MRELLPNAHFVSSDEHNAPFSFRFWIKTVGSLRHATTLLAISASASGSRPFASGTVRTSKIPRWNTIIPTMDAVDCERQIGSDDPRLWMLIHRTIDLSVPIVQKVIEDYVKNMNENTIY